MHVYQLYLSLVIKSQLIYFMLIFACGVIDHMAGCHQSHLCKDLNFIAMLSEQVNLWDTDVNRNENDISV